MLKIIDNGIKLKNGKFSYLWFRLDTPEGERFRVLTLRELAVLPRPISEAGEREGLNFYRRQVAALRGLHNAGVDFVYTAAGIFHPEHVGVVQMYGATAEDSTLDGAARLALQRQAAVQAIMANHIQSRLEPPNVDWILWMMEFAEQRATRILALLGHPDPRDAPKGLGDDQSEKLDDLAAEQNEALFRALAAVRKDFVFQIAGRRLSRALLARHLVNVSRQVTQIASRQRGTRSIGFSLSIPLMTAIARTYSGSHSAAVSHGHTTANGVSHGWSIADTHGHAHTEGTAVTDGWSVSHGVNHSTTKGQSHSVSRGVTDGVSHGGSVSDTITHSVSHASTVSQSATVGSGHTVSHSTTDSSGTTMSSGVASGVSSGMNWGLSAGVGGSQSSAHTDSGSTSVTGSTAHTSGTQNSINASVSVGADAKGSIGIASAGMHSNTTVGGSHGWNNSTTTSGGVGVTIGSADTNSTSTNWSKGTFIGANVSHSVVGSHGVAHTTGHAVTNGTADSAFQSYTRGTAHTEGESWGSAHTTGKTWGVSHSRNYGITNGTNRAQSSGTTDTVTASHSVTRSVSDTVSDSHTKGQNWGQNHSEADTHGVSHAQMLGAGWGTGLSTGLLPGVSVGKSWQDEDDLAIRLTNLMRSLTAVLDRATAEGGFMTNALLMVADDEAAEAAAAAVPQAFHGPDVPTPVFTVPPDPQDEPVLRQHALAFRPWEEPQEDGRDPFSGILWTKYATLLTPEQMAAYTAPGAFAEGTVKLVEKIPKNKIMFYSDMKGDVVLGHQFSPETGQLTKAPVRFDPWAFMHFLFAANSGYGKTVGAERLVYELGKKLGFQEVVLDFGFGWRKLVNAPGMGGRVDVRQLYPFAPRPLRWNPLRISRYIPPTQFLKGFIDTWDQLTQMGQKQQRIWFETLIREMYVDAGALTDDPDVWEHPVWGHVQADEAALVDAPEGTHLRDFVRSGEYDKLQILAIHRSTANPKLSLKALYDRIEEAKDRFGPRDRIMQDILSGLMVRLRPLVVGAPALQFAPGREAVDLPDLLEGKNIIILEGKGLDKRAAGFLLGWAGWVFYYNRVNRRQRQMDTAPMFMFYEEANVIFSGLSASGNRDDNVQSLAESYDNMVRDSRKYKIFFGFAAQNPSLLPTGVLHSCPNAFIGRITDPEDKKQVLSLLGFTEVGFQDNEMRRILSDLSVAMMLGRLSYAFERRETQTFLFRPLLLDVPEPTDDDLAKKLGRIDL